MQFVTDKRGDNMEKSNCVFTKFVREDRFELNSYLTYLFNLISDHFPEQLDDRWLMDKPVRK